MGTPKQSLIPATTSGQWDRRTIFVTLADPVRLGLFVSLARGGPSNASQLRVSVNRKLDATVKQLAYLRDVGFVVAITDPNDGRRALYSIAPAVPIEKTPTGVNADFGVCLLRL